MYPTVRLVSCLLIWIISILLFTLPLIILLIYKFCVLSLVKLHFLLVGGAELIPLKPLDSMITGGQDITSNMIIGIVCRLRGEISLSNLQQHFVKTFLNSEDKNDTDYRLSSTLVTFGGYQFFRKLDLDEINIQRQIYTRQIQGGDARLEDFLCNWAHEKFAENSPCWEMVLVGELDGGNGIKERGTVVGMKFHHGFMDGVSARHIFDRLTGNGSSPNLARIEPKLSWKKAILRMIEAPLHLNLLKGDASSNPFQIKLTKQPSEWTMACTTLDLEMLKAIRKQENVYFASIIFTIMGGALRRYLLQERKQLPQYFYMATAQPWPDHPALKPGKNSAKNNGEKICNLWLPSHFAIPSGDLSPRASLREVEKSFASFQEKGVHKFFQHLVPPLLNLLPNCVGIKGVDVGFTAAYSTMVGGIGYKLLGQGVEDIHLFVTADDLTPYLPIILGSFTHDGKYQLTVGASCQNFRNGSDLERVVKMYLQEELDVLYSSSR